MILLYLVPVIVSFVVFSLRELNIERERTLMEGIINKQHCTIFKHFKKIKMTPQQNIANSVSPDQLDEVDPKPLHASKQLEDKPKGGYSNFKKEKAQKAPIHSQRSQNINPDLSNSNNQQNTNNQNPQNTTPNNQAISSPNNMINLISLNPITNSLGNSNNGQKNQIEQSKKDPNATVPQKDSSQINSNAQINNSKSPGIKDSVTITSHYQKINTRVMNNVVKTVKIFEEVRWEQLEIGSIVWLKNGEIAPADLLILDTRQSFCTVEEDIMNGKTSQTEKFPPQLTSVSVNSKLKTNMFEYRKLLSGKIEYTRQSKRKDFSGFLKMSKDPKGENLDQRNILYRGSKLVFSEWVFGLVLYAGKDCKIYQQSYNKETMKPSFFGKKAKLFFLVAYIHVLLSTAVSLFFVIFQPCYTGFSTQWLKQQDPLGIILSFFIEYLHILPQLFYTVVDLIEMVNDLYHNKYFQKIDLQTQNNQSGNNYQMLRSVTLGDISLTNFVFLDKTGTITDGEKQQVRCVIVDGQLYSINIKMIDQILRNKSFNVNNFNKSIKELIDNDNMVIADEKISVNEQPGSFPNVLNFIPNSSFQAQLQLKKPILPRDVSIKHSDESEDFDEEEFKDEVKNSMDSRKMKILAVPGSPDSTSLNNSFQKENAVQDNNSLEKIRQAKLSETIQNSRLGSYKLCTNNPDNILDENDFINNLYNDYDKRHHEALLSTVICNQVMSYYDTRTDCIQNTNVTKEGEMMVEFSKLFNYQLKCSSVYKGQSFSPNYIVHIQGNYQ